MQPIPILAYHSIAKRDNEKYDRWCVTPYRLNQQLSVLFEEKYTVLSTSGLVDLLKSNAPVPERCAVLTFDDGLHDFWTGAYPILEKFGFPATLYAVAGLIGKTSRWLHPLAEGDRNMLNVAELRELAAANYEIGSHSMTHPELDVLDTQAALMEITNSRRILEDIIGAPVRSFAYPHGYASGETRRLVRESGYDSAVRVRHALSMSQENLFGLSRLVITENLDNQSFSAMLKGANLPIAPPQDRLAGQIWRFVRRHRLPKHGSAQRQLNPFP